MKKKQKQDAQLLSIWTAWLEKKGINQAKTPYYDTTIKQQKSGTASVSSSLKHKKNITMSLKKLKQKVLEAVKDEKEAKAIIFSIDKNPKEYEKYLTMSRPLDELLADWA